MGMGTGIRRQIDERIWLILGFGLFMVPYGGGPFGYLSGTSHEGFAWQSVLLIQVAFFAGVVLGCLGVRFLTSRGEFRSIDAIGAACLVAINLFGLIMQPLIDGMTGQMAVVTHALLSTIAGLFHAVPLIFWVGRLHAYGRSSSHLDVVGTLVLCYLLLPIIVLPCSIFPVPYGYSILQLLCAIASVAMQAVVIRKAQAGDAEPDQTSERKRLLDTSEVSAQVYGRSEGAGEGYRLMPYSFLLLTCLGFSWGAAAGSSVYGLVNIPVGGTGSGFVGAFAFMLAAALSIWALRRKRDVKFGFIIRLSIVACGVVLAAIPLIYTELPVLLYPACNLAMIAGEILLILFSIDICVEEGRRVGSVFTLNYVTFMATSCLSSVLFYVAQEVLGGLTAWMVVSVVSVWAILAVIPFIPSRSSDAVALTSQTLPEDEGYEANIAMRRERMVRRYSLTEGEALVLEGLMQGKKREQIAEELMLSPWTVKARTSSIYKKCGVDSFKGLVQLVSKD